MSKAFIFIFILAYAAISSAQEFAGPPTPNELFCGVSTNGWTPTETARQGYESYRTAEVKRLNLSQINIDIEDSYGDGKGNQNYTVSYQPDNYVTSVNGIALGEYSENVEIKLSPKGRITLHAGGFIYACEVPYNYQESYEVD